MPVTDDGVAALRALLHGDRARYHRIRGRMDRTTTGPSWAAFMTAAFIEAVRRRFATDTTENDVINYVAAIRSEDEETGEQIDPRAAERLILAVAHDEDADDIDAKTMGGIFIVFVAALIRDEQLDDNGIDEFLAAARKLADAQLAQLGE